MSATCILCSGQLLNKEDVTEVFEKGLQTLKKVSKERGDGLFLKVCGPIKLHCSCRKKYVARRSKTELSYKTWEVNKRNAEEINPSIDSAPPPEKKTRRSDPFDFDKLCFICNKSIPNLRKQAHNNCLTSIITETSKASVFQTLTDCSKKGFPHYAEAADRLIGARLGHDIPTYHKKCFTQTKNLLGGGSVGAGQGRLYDAQITEEMEKVFAYLEESRDTTFKLSELKDMFDRGMDDSTVFRRIQERYGDCVKFLNKPGSDTYITFTENQYKVLKESWREKNVNNERQKEETVRDAAAILRHEISKQVYETRSYADPETLFSETQMIEDIPNLLYILISGIINKEKIGDGKVLMRKCVLICHLIIAATRPRSFMSSLLLGLAVMLYQKFACKNLLNIFSNLGITSSYNEARLYIQSNIVGNARQFLKDIWVSFGFDNADFPRQNVDGSGSSNVTGGGLFVDPVECYSKSEPIPKLKYLKSAAEMAALHAIPTHKYIKNIPDGWDKIVVKNLSIPEFSNKNFNNTDLVHMFGKINNPSFKGWNGFQSNLTKNFTFQKGRTICLPFYNAPSSHPNSLMSVLKYAVARATEVGIKTVFVTFDQPLYKKAVQIVKTCGDPEVSKIRVRLGGFHLLMSFLSCIGALMAGSGLEELLQTCYATKSIEKILNGKSYARAIRAHFLVYIALAEFIIRDMKLTDDESTLLRKYINSENNVDYNKIMNDKELSGLVERYLAQMQATEERGKTAKLWIEYKRMIGIARSFLRCEKMGDFKTQLEIIQQMLPYFHATGHPHYANSAHYYCQEMNEYVAEMEKLCQSQEPSLELSGEDLVKIKEYQRYVVEGRWTLRRSNHFWCGTFSDMGIEQDVMRLIKVQGGLPTRHFTDSTTAQFILGIPYAREVIDPIEKFAGVYFESSDQHIDASDSRVKKDTNDLNKMRQWLTKYDPFPFDPLLKSIFTGVVGNEKINCFNIRAVGKSSFESVVGSTFGAFKISTSKKIISLRAATNLVKVNEKEVTIDPLLLFQRLSINNAEQYNLTEALQYELTPYPLSIFDSGALRKTDKSGLMDLFSSRSFDLPKEDCYFVIDGGWLLHRVVWGTEGSSFGNIIKRYVEYVKRWFGANVIVVFDGYGNNSNSIKSAERGKRAFKNSCADISFTKLTINTIPQAKFLSNSYNKTRLISYLITEFEEANMLVKQAEDDADVLIVQTALANCSETPVVVAEDTDIAALIVGLTPANREVYLLKMEKGLREEDGLSGLLYSSKSLDNDPFIRDNILFFHAATGCDTVSSYFGKGKTGRSVRPLAAKAKKDNNLRKGIEFFQLPDQTQNDVIKHGEYCIMAIYNGAKKDKNLNDIRLSLFSKGLRKTKPVNLATLPPTSDAAQFHSMRIYCQIQSWLSKPVSPTEWGWKMRSDRLGLDPITMSQAMAPENLLKQIFCNCKKGCNGGCSCRKAGLKCTDICHSRASSGNCSNCDEPVVEENNELNLLDESDEINDDENDPDCYVPVEPVGENENDGQDDECDDFSEVVELINGL